MTMCESRQVRAPGPSDGMREFFREGPGGISCSIPKGMCFQPRGTYRPNGERRSGRVSLVEAVVGAQTRQSGIPTVLGCLGHSRMQTVV